MRNWIWSNPKDTDLDQKASEAVNDLRAAAEETKRQAEQMEKLARQMLRQKREDHGARLNAMLNQLMPKGNDE